MKIIKLLLKCWNANGIAVRPRTASSPLLLALEPRVVYDASVAAAAPAPHAHETVHEHSHEHVQEHAQRAPTETSPVSVTPPASQAAPQAGATNAGQAHGATASPANTAQPGASDPARSLATLAAAGLASRDTGGTHQVVFIDPSVANYQTLIAGLPAGTQYVVLNANTDGFAQIAQYLQTHHGVESISLISHGTDGAVQAGSTWLTQSDLSAYSAQLAQIGAAMKPGGDFLIYGCDVAQQADGQALVQQIAAITHLNVAASTNATGATALGGDWVLEYQVGNVHTALNESASAKAQFNELLGVTVETYDAAANNNFAAIGVAHFTLDGITYSLDQVANTFAYNDSNSPNGPTDITDSPTDGVLEINADGSSSMSNVTIMLANGHTFSLQQFDLSSFNGDLYIQAHYANGTSSGLIQLATASVGGFTGTVSSQLGSAFNNIVSFSLIDQNDTGSFEPSLDNLVYSDTGPAVTTSSGSAAWSSADNGAGTGGAPVAVDAGLTLSDGGSSTAKTATVAITNVQTGDVLGFTAQNGISGSYNSTTGTLTLTTGAGTATIAQWQAALESVTFSSSLTSPNLSSTTRTVSFSFNDGTFSSNLATRNVTVTATDQTPVLSEGGATSTSYLAGATATAIDANVHVGDADNASLATATVSIASGSVSGDSLAFTNNNSTLYGDIQASFNASTHQLSLFSGSGTASLAQWQAALDAVTFSSSTSTTSGTRDITFSVSDGSKTSALLHHSVVVTAGPVVTTDSGSASFVTGDNAASTPVAVDSGIVISDGSSGTLASATVQVAGNFQANHDELLFVNNPATMGNISAVYDTSTGVLTLTSASGTATLAQWQAALRSVTFTSDLVVPSNATRTISFGINDGSLSSPLATRTLTVTDTDQTPIIGGGGATASFVAGDNATSTPVVVDNAITVADADGGPLHTATAAITGNLQPTDILTFNNTSAALYGDIAGSYSNGVLTLFSSSATATLAQWQAALRSVTYTSSAITPSSAPRTVSFSVSDGTKTSTTVSATVNVTDTDQTPLISGTSGTVTFTQSDNTSSPPVTVDNGITLTDRDNGTLASATITIGNFDSGGDTLQVILDPATMGNISGSYSNGVLTLTSSDASVTLAQWQAALRSVQFQNVSAVPNTTPRVISFIVSDGTKTSTAWTRTVDVVATDQTPVVSTSGGSATFTAGDNVASTPVAVDTGIVLSDADNTTLASATVQVGSGFHVGEDVLSFTNDGATMGNIAASYDASTGVLTLTSAGASATLAQWQTALRSVTYTDTAITPDTTTRTISFTVSDGTKTSAAVTRDITVSDTDQTPVISTSSTGPTSFVSGDNTASTPVTVDSGIALADLDNSTLASATVQIGSGFHAGEDVLSFTNDGATMGNITASYDASTGVLTLTSVGASATLAQWQTALCSVTYTDTAVTPNTTPRTISFTVNDGTRTSAALSRTVTVAADDQTPMISSSSTGSVPFVAGDNVASTPVAVDTGIVLSDLDNTTLASATIQVGGGFHAGEDVLSFTNDGATMGNIAASYNASTGVLTLTSAGASATLAQWQTALRSVTYTDTAITPDTTTRTISFTVSDGTKTSTAVTRSITVSDTDQTPVISTSSTGPTSFVSGDNTASTPVMVDSGITLTDLDNSTLASATVQVGSGFHVGEDVLSFTNDGATMGNIAASYDASTGVLTLTSAGASATLAQWQTALRSVTYIDTALKPNTTSRTISFIVNDGTRTSAALSRTVDVTATHQTLGIAGGSETLTYTASGANAVPVMVGGGITLSDANATPLQSANVALTGTFDPQHDVLGFTGNAATGDITASYDAAHGVLTLSSAGGTATLAQWQAALAAVTYADTQVEHANGTRTISFTISDGVAPSTALTRTVQIVGVPQATVTSPQNPPSAPPILPPTPPAVVQAPDVHAPPVIGPAHSNPLIANDDTGHNDGVSNPLIVLDMFAPKPQLGSIVAPTTLTFATSAPRRSSLGETHVSAPAPIELPQPVQPLDAAFALPSIDMHPGRAADGSFVLALQPLAGPAAQHGASHVAEDLTVVQANGAPLPAWLHYDAARGVLSGVPPAGVHEVRVMVVSRDAAGQVTRREVIVSFDTAHPTGGAHHDSHKSAPPAGKPAASPAAPQAALPAAKPSLAAQFARAQAALHIARPAGDGYAVSAMAGDSHADPHTNAAAQRGRA